MRDRDIERLCPEALVKIGRLRGLLDGARILMRNMDRSEREQVLYDDICRALDGEKG